VRAAPSQPDLKSEASCFVDRFVPAARRTFRLIFSKQPPGQCRVRAGTKPKRKYRVLIADRGGVFRLGLKKLFAIEDDFRVVAQAENAAQIPLLAKKFQAELIFVQSEIAQEGPGDLLARIHQALPESKILIVGEGLREDEMESFINRGASGIMLRSANPENFIKCALKAMKSKHSLPKPDAEPQRASGPTESVLRPVDTLTRREKSIISCLLQGWRNREIAVHLSITEQTVKNHLRTIFDKVGVSDRLEMVLYAIHHRMELPPPTPSAT
jgi:DNA-binding NarL/FixJ family response regulator